MLKGRSAAYVYTILVDGIVRYIGKGRNGRLYAHLIEAKRTAARSGAKTASLHPRWRRNLVQAIRAGSEITESVIGYGLTDEEAYRLESKIIADFHRFQTDQLWNTIDERFMDKRLLPPEWNDPENLLYKLSRPLVESSMHPRSTQDACKARKIENRTGACAAKYVVPIRFSSLILLGSC